MDPLAMEGHNIFFIPYQFSSNNPIYRVDKSGLFDDIIDVEKNTGKITITKAPGDDIVRLSDNGKTLSSYYYGTNGSFVQENTLFTDKNDGKRQNIVSTNSMNAMKFFKFAANSDVEYGFSKFNNYKTKTSFCVVSTNQSNNSISISSEIEIYVLTFLPNTYLSESWHTHPGPYDKYSGWPAYPSGFDQYGIPNEDNKGDRANFMFFHTKFPTQSPNYMYILIPSTNMIVKYNNYEYEVL